jgi:predicted small metal-binding protein
MTRAVICADAGYDCAFEIRSENDDELISMVQQHAEGTHDTSLAPDEVRGIWREV